VHLRRVQLTGFKSFADKTVLELETGITAVVGPNGSGKSNLADAVRWALGEQSRGRLRLSDREEVIFAGTTKRPRASYAEVVLVFNNDDGTFPLDLTEIEISRRLYRSGEGEYRLAGRAVRLGDIQALMAQAGFGAGTYAVIGQGMIDSFLLSPPAERKLLFEEAAGIRGPELSREAALRKLAATTTNLVRLRDISAELAPRLEGLERAVAAGREQQALEAKVLSLRALVTAVALSTHGAAESAGESRLSEVLSKLDQLKKDRSELEQNLRQLQKASTRAASERDKLRAALAQLEQQRDQLGLQLGEHKAAVSIAEAAGRRGEDVRVLLTAARTELKTAEARHQELSTEMASNSHAAARALKAVDKAGAEVSAAGAELVALRKRAAGADRDQYAQHALEVIKLVATDLNSADLPLERIRLLVHKAGRLLKAATESTAGSELMSALAAAQKHLEQAMGKRETAVEHQTNITITGRSLEIDLAHQIDALARAGSAVTGLEDELKTVAAGASQLKAVQVKVESVIQALAQNSQQLEEQRQRIQRLEHAGDGADSAGVSAQLERASALMREAQAETTSLKHGLQAARSGSEAARRRAADWGIDPEKLPNPAAGAHLPQLEADLLKTEAALEAHAAAYRDQAAEYEAVGTRHAELAGQIRDLEQAQADLGQVVTQLDSVIRERFKANFQTLAEQFSAYFTQLFGGGSASLTLQTGPDDTYGIEIKASPKGKRLTNLQTLSGGERALAGVALLAAILRVNPSPFVVLDEIDAALDEANSGRLAAILGELQEHSQLIVITHNRQTMNAARVLFGVTTGEHHTSRILSMKLEDATVLAAR
jgi:chromosome segregation protein